ncbi:uncharacterized protein K460DRAFT_182256 [Cucurbitaria berberidis CBS 394.84]|uniref:Mid2 domain-containing protein n=1 Tax=Cucurbitaria berberidis CBS 394.84 TaxID=1168544 RepID=A0A9P4L5G5_9PLEO|nr:uncharacterized protein K460DRAFT_182256 [Cucurbitaria berberidis CBS 394.84]KAF1842317.1 hypothetical protein K460DRAFT_182256 [Cucurbitaria berberidis CBS 394.84]
MTFDPGYPRGCLSHFSTAFRAYAPITTTPAYSGATVTPVYEYTSWSPPSGGSQVPSIISSITTLTAGLAIADPVVVAWQIDDFRLFPSDYATSLAKRINITLPTSTSTTNLSEPTSTPQSNSLSTGAKAGIGVGAVLGAAIIGVVMTILYLRKRRKAAATVQDPSVPEMEDQDRNFREHKWFFGGRWRSEVETEAAQNALDSKAVHVVPGPPAELEASEPPVHIDTGDVGESRTEGTGHYV